MEYANTDTSEYKIGDKVFVDTQICRDGIPSHYWFTVKKVCKKTLILSRIDARGKEITRRTSPRFVESHKPVQPIQGYKLCKPVPAF